VRGEECGGEGIEGRGRGGGRGDDIVRGKDRFA